MSAISEPYYPQPTAGAVHDPIWEAEANARHAANLAKQGAKLAEYAAKHPNDPIIWRVRLWIAEDRARAAEKALHSARANDDREAA